MRQLFQHDPVVGYRYVPGLKARIPHEGGGYLVRVNQTGFRSNREFLPEPTPGMRRALLFGDSYTAGDSVPAEKRFGDLIESLVPNLEVYNYGIPGTGTDQHYLAYKEYAKGIAHDLVIVCVLVENVRRIVSRYREYVDDEGSRRIFAKPYFELEGDALAVGGVPVPAGDLLESEVPVTERSRIENGRLPHLRAAVSKLGLKELAQKLTRFQPLPEYDAPENPSWRLMQAILTDWARSSRVPLLVVPLPIYQYVEDTSDPASYRVRFQELSRSAPCLLHDPMDDILARPIEERKRFRYASDVHPTPSFHALLAESIAKGVRSALDAETLPKS